MGKKVKLAILPLLHLKLEKGKGVLISLLHGGVKCLHSAQLTL